MPKDISIKTILIIGSGPIVIGQGCEFDYSGVQACKVLKDEGYRIILVNSNPATIMTDPEFATKTYVEPLDSSIIEKIIEKEKPNAILPTLGGQTALNVSMELYKSGFLEKNGVKMIGANASAIEKGEDRSLFKKAMLKIGLDMPKSGTANSLSEAREVAQYIGSYPLIIRPAYTLGGSGGGIAYNKEEFEEISIRGLDLSPTTEILVEESLLGWKEYEMEVIRDKNDNCVVICSIENFDPMGVHTGDSITVVPSQTLSDREYQKMRDASFSIIREIGVETGGSNIQFSINPDNGRMIVIEMNPRVSRSSALASKATGFPIAKIAAKLAVGYTLDEIPNDITKNTPASFEPAIDYCVVKIPRFTFEKFPDADSSLTTQMKSVGEVMSIGRTFKESLQKALRSLEIGCYGLGPYRGDNFNNLEEDDIKEKLVIPNSERIFYIRIALKKGMDLSEIHNLTKIDPWFLRSIQEIVLAEDDFNKGIEEIDFNKAKKLGFSDQQISFFTNTDIDKVREKRKSLGIIPKYRLVDTCAAEFEASTPYYYSNYGEENESRNIEEKKKKIMILGGGPNRIGQGIEFDYCCVHASFALKELGFETIMVNSNPETVSTDYDISDKLYFEPLTLEDVLNIYEQEECWGVIVQLGGQTPLNLASDLEKNGCNVIGTSTLSIEKAEDREFFSKLLTDLNLHQAPLGTAKTKDQAIKIANEIGYPVLVRPSFVLGGRAMMIVYRDEELIEYINKAFEISSDRPILIDKFLEDAIEVDVDCISDGDVTVIGGIMEHIEEAGIHSGDSACVLPSFSLDEEVFIKINESAKTLAKALNVKGLMNIQFAVKDGKIYVIEVNPRASRTIPFVSKAIGVPLSKLAAKVMAGSKLNDLGFTKSIKPDFFSVKEAVFPFSKFPGIDISLGPEMKSTGEVMGIDVDLGAAYAKSQIASYCKLPTKGNIFISVKDSDKPLAMDLANEFNKLGFKIFSTSGTADFFIKNGIKVQKLYKLNKGRPNVIDIIKNDGISMVINTPQGKIPRSDEVRIRSVALANHIPIITTIRAAQACIRSIKSLQTKGLKVRPLQEYY